jgi:hypothetical protein
MSNGNMEWQIRAMGQIENGLPIHWVEREELLEQGFITIPHPNSTKMVITVLGQEVLRRSKTSDYASKRY